MRCQAAPIAVSTSGLHLVLADVDHSESSRLRSAPGSPPVRCLGNDRGNPAGPRCRPARADDPPQHLLAGARREAVPAGSRLNVLVERCGEVGGFYEVFDLVRDGPPSVRLRRVDRSSSGVRHEAALFHVGGALTVESGPGALGFAGGDQLEATVVVEQGGGRIDPPEADRFFDDFGVGASRSAGARTPRAQPHASGRRVVVLEPRSPLGPGLDVADRIVELPRGGMVGRRRSGLSRGHVVSPVSSETATMTVPSPFASWEGIGGISTVPRMRRRVGHQAPWYEVARTGEQHISTRHRSRPSRSDRHFGSVSWRPRSQSGRRISGCGVGPDGTQPRVGSTLQADIDSRSVISGSDCAFAAWPN